MITRLDYEIYKDKAYLWRTEEGEGNELIIAFKRDIDGWLTVGPITRKISHGVVSLPTSRLGDGVHAVSAETSLGKIELIPIEMRCGTLALRIGSTEIARMLGEIYTLRLLTADLRELAARLESAVFGNKIF